MSLFEKLFKYTPDYSSLKVFGSTCFVLRRRVECNKLFLCFTICVFLGYGAGQKGYHCFDQASQKLYVSHQVLFLEHILFFFIPSSSHNLTKSNLIHIDPLYDDQDSLSPIPNTTDIGTPIPDVFDNIGTSILDAPDTSSYLITSQVPLETEDPLPPYTKRGHKYTQLPNFLYSCYF